MAGPRWDGGDDDGTAFLQVVGVIRRSSCAPFEVNALVAPRYPASSFRLLLGSGLIWNPDRAH